jgi:dUTP pyrophosphatase
MNNSVICFAKVRPDAIIPSKRDCDGGYDVYANFHQDSWTIYPHTSSLIPTGIASAFTDDYVFLLEERGSSGIKNLKRNAGVIDSGYRNEWFVCLYNANDKPIIITKETNKWTLQALEEDYIVYPYSKALCQGLLLHVPKVRIKELPLDELQAIPSERGLGRLGSSGK